MTTIKSFAAGFLSTLVFHQGLLYLMVIAGLVTAAPYNMASTEPFGVPKVVSLAFWGGLWGVVLWFFIRTSRGADYWWKALLIGAVAPSLVAWFVVMPLKGMGFAGGWDPKIFVFALLLNGAWGLGVAAFLKALRS